MHVGVSVAVAVAVTVGVSVAVFVAVPVGVARAPTAAVTLRCIADELLGLAPMKETAKPRNNRLKRRLQQIEQLGAREKRQVLQVLDAFLERAQLKQRLSAAE